MRLSEPGRVGAALAALAVTFVGVNSVGTPAVKASECVIRITKEPTLQGDRVTAEGRIDCFGNEAINADGKLYIIKQPGEYMEMDNDSCHAVIGTCTVTPSEGFFGHGITWCFQMFARAGGDLYETQRACRRI